VAVLDGTPVAVAAGVSVGTGVSVAVGGAELVGVAVAPATGPPPEPWPPSPAHAERSRTIVATRREPARWVDGRAIFMGLIYARTATEADGRQSS
jgi:hypothetical protein